MDILLLKTFLTVCQTGSFSAAAEELNSVQSNITSRIKRLEEHFGQAVFERGRGGARLNSFGKRLQAHAEDLMTRFELAERDLLEAAGTNAPLRLGSMETTAAVRLPEVLKRVKQTFPSMPISLRTGTTGELLSLVRNRKLDAAFIAGPVDESRFNSIPAFKERLVVASPKKLETANALLAFRTGCSYRTMAEAWLREMGKGDTEILEMGTLDGILGCVEVGMGFAVAPEMAIKWYRGAEALKLTLLPEPYREAETCLVWRPDLQMTRGFEGLISILENPTQTEKPKQPA